MKNFSLSTSDKTEVITRVNSKKSPLLVLLIYFVSQIDDINLKCILHLHHIHRNYSPYYIILYSKLKPLSN
jgi:hypothetical protein